MVVEVTRYSFTHVQNARQKRAVLRFRLARRRGGLSLCHAFPLRKIHNFSGGIRGRGARVNHTKRGTACRAFCFYSVISSTRCSMAVCRFIYTTFRRPSLSLHMAGWHLFPGAAASSIRFFQVFPSSFE